MNEEQLFGLIENYFSSIGVSASDVSGVFDRQNFRQAAVKRLPNVCIRAHNRSTSSNQSHIHLTGNERFVFYDTITGPRDNEMINLLLVKQNLEHLQFIESVRRKHFVSGLPLQPTNYQSDSTISILNSVTTKKIAGRSAEDNQVQISNIRLDGEDFRRLRDATFKGDLLIFLQYIDAPNTYLTLVIPNIGPLLNSLRSQLGIRIILSNGIQAEMNNVNNESDERNGKVASRFTLNSVNSTNIANYSRSIAEEQELYDLSSGIEMRALRTERHQRIVRNLAKFLEQSRFDLYAGNIDCLAFKEDHPILIFEIKTLDGRPSDEVNQVKKALSQLLYYERFATNDYYEYDSYKFVLFENQISTEHIDFLQENECFVLYLDENAGLQGSKEAIDIISTYINNIQIYNS